MRVVRAVIVVVASLGGLFVASSPASAQVSQISIGQPQLGPEGGSLVVPLTVVCPVGFNLAFGDVKVVQSHGRFLAQGSGSFSNTFPVVLCTGAPQTLTINVSDISPFRFKQGKSVASADVTVVTPFGPITDSVGPQTVRIAK